MLALSPSLLSIDSDMNSSNYSTAANTPRICHKLVPGLFRSKQDNSEYLISEFSFVVLRGGKQYSCFEFSFHERTRHMTAKAHVWEFDLIFTENFDSIESGIFCNMSTQQTQTYGVDNDQLQYHRVGEFGGEDKKQDIEPALYHSHDDHIAFVFSTYSFVVLMDGKVYNSTSFHYDASTRHVVATAHIWEFNFQFSHDFCFVESGQYTDNRGLIWQFGIKKGQLLLQKATDSKCMF